MEKIKIKKEFFKKILIKDLNENEKFYAREGVKRGLVIGILIGACIGLQLGQFIDFIVWR